MDAEGKMWEALRIPASFWNEKLDGQRCHYPRCEAQEEKWI